MTRFGLFEGPRRSEPSFGRGSPVRTPGKIDKPLWAPTFGGPAETKKARSVVASSRVPRLAGFAGSPPAAGLPGAVNWPLVQIPANRHTTTGTCVLGNRLFVRIAPRRKGFLGRDEIICETRAGIRKKSLISRQRRRRHSRVAIHLCVGLGDLARVPRAPSDLKPFQIEAFLIFTLHSCPPDAPLLDAPCSRKIRERKARSTGRNAGTQCLAFPWRPSSPPP